MNDSLFISCNSNLLEERKYILDILLIDFLGLDYTLRIDESLSNTTFEFAGINKFLFLTDAFFSVSPAAWLTRETIPAIPLTLWQPAEIRFANCLTAPSIPMIFKGNANKIYDSDKQGNVYFDIDILGSCFFMLSRYEEYVFQEKDIHSRFISNNSLAVKENFVLRPIVNEYLEILWILLIELNKDLVRKKWKFNVHPSHDVDKPFKYLNKPIVQVLKENYGLYKTKEIGVLQAFKKVAIILKSKLLSPRYDPYFIFDWIMDLSMKYNFTSAFYFITYSSNAYLDCDYSMFDKEIIKLLIDINEKGHSIGLHPSYNSLNQTEKICREFDTLLKCCKKAGIVQDFFGSRQHYLRFHLPDLWQALETANVRYDTSMGFADRPGFRAGVCYPYRVYDLIRRIKLNLIEKPLVVMEMSFLHPKYLGFTIEQTQKEIFILLEKCKKYEGIFSILWHNSFFEEPGYKVLYENILRKGFELRNNNK